MSDSQEEENYNSHESDSNDTEEESEASNVQRGDQTETSESAETPPAAELKKKRKPRLNLRRSSSLNLGERPVLLPLPRTRDKKEEEEEDEPEPPELEPSNLEDTSDSVSSSILDENEAEHPGLSLQRSLSGDSSETPITAPLQEPCDSVDTPDVDTPRPRSSSLSVTSGPAGRKEAKSLNLEKRALSEDLLETPIFLPLRQTAEPQGRKLPRYLKRSNSDIGVGSSDSGIATLSGSVKPLQPLPSVASVSYISEKSSPSSSSDDYISSSNVDPSAGRHYVPRRQTRRSSIAATPSFEKQPSKGRRLSVSFGDVTTIDENYPGGRRKSLPAGLGLAPLYDPSGRRKSIEIDFNSIILNAGLNSGSESPLRPRRRSLVQMMNAFPEWLASKQPFGSLSSLATSRRTSMSSLHSNDSDLDIDERRFVKRRKGLSRLLDRARQGYLNDESVLFPRVLQPADSLWGFETWIDVENPSLMMYGRYTKDLGRYAREEAKKLKKEEKTGSGASGLRPYRGKVATKCLRILGTIWQATFARVGEDWVFLAVLGIVMAIISFIMDYGIAICNKARIWLYRDLASHTALQYLAWVSLPVCLILFSAGFVHILAPQAVGSGIPEMKTILRGVVLKEYLTFKTLIAKVIGLTATLGSGLPLGKEGPFVHIASIVATLLSKAVTSFKGIYENESRNSEMLAAACAVGVACSFAAPIGGVLFSIEVTSVYFAVRNYWRGFFAAVCGAMMFRLLAVWFNDEDTLTPLFETSYKVDIPFDPQEIVVFALIGVMSGFLGALFVWVHRQYVIFMRKNKKMKAFLQKSRLLFPLLLTVVIMSITFPDGMGQFLVAHLTTHHQVVDLFSNVTWTKEELSVQEFEIVENWRTPWTGVFVNLIVYITFTFCATVVASTLPVPSGIFIPVFKMGAALGRFMGEAMACTFPNGLRYGGHNHIIIPGGYSIVGAAALAGAVTHTISTSVIVFELTGQITHILPVMIAVLIANAIAQLLQPSVYDSIIQIKKLPYLPDILTATSGAYNIYVEDFMVRDVKYIWYGITYRQLKNILKEHKKIRSLPLVDSPDSMILLGSIQRSELISMLEEHLGKDRRLRVINKWKLAAQNLHSLSGTLCKLPSMRRRNTLCGALEAEQMEQEAEEAKREEERKKRLMDIEEGKKPVPSAGLAMVAGIGGALAAATGIGFNFRGDQSPDSSPPSTTATPESTPILTSTPTTSSAATAVNPVISLTTSEITEDTENKQRRPSRFEVVKVDSPARHESTVTLQIDPVEIPTASESALHRPSEAALRSPLPKSILKKTNSFILHPAPSSPFVSPQHTPYATVHAGDSRLRQAFEAVLRKTSLLKMEDKGIHSSQNLATPTSASKRVSLPADRMIEMTLEEQRRWEEEELNKEVDFSKCHIDPAPFQLVERTSLLKVHSLFSMLGLNHAYVTAIGRIIGVVALKELRKAIEETNSGDFPKPEAAPPPTVPPEEASEPLNSATVNNEEKD
ncbi:chloride channel protein 2-like isoform X6 [Macrobrachium nipponense]|uniref:chloride channel protein 2-like isoform X6 n=1 Tax=Macrobrachium nipponense TaxID=159736 RepID=UPI0030C8CF23